MDKYFIYNENTTVHTEIDSKTWSRFCKDRKKTAGSNGSTEITPEIYSVLNTRPDFEEELAKLIGDTAAHQAGLAARSLQGWLATVRTGFGRSTADYLQEESRDLPAVAEVEELNREIDLLAQAVDRAEARLRKIQNNAT